MKSLHLKAAALETRLALMIVLADDAYEGTFYPLYLRALAHLRLLYAQDTTDDTVQSMLLATHAEFRAEEPEQLENLYDLEGVWPLRSRLQGVYDELDPAYALQKRSGMCSKGSGRGPTCSACYQEGKNHSYMGPIESRRLYACSVCKTVFVAE